MLGTGQPAETGQLTVLAAGPSPHQDTFAPAFDARRRPYDVDR
ncbi:MULTISPECIES: hypothetical protein [Streptomyces]